MDRPADGTEEKARGAEPLGAHLEHVRKLLGFQASKEAGTAATELTPRTLFLVKDEGVTFWELVGLRVRGHPGIVIGALRFRKQSGSRNVYPRCPLAMYLDSPPKEGRLGRASRPSGMIEILVPKANEDIPAFQRRMAHGEVSRVLLVDTAQIEFAFDFRTENASVERDRLASSRLQVELHVFRTAGGYLLSGHTHGLQSKIHGDSKFVTMRTPKQHGPKGVYTLPTVALNRARLAVDVVIEPGSTVGDALASSVLLDPASAVGRHMLLPEV